jgi:phage FluMu protein Com
VFYQGQLNGLISGISIFINKSMPNQIAFHQVRCVVCRHIIVEVAATLVGLLRSKCKRCSSLSVVACETGKPPRIIDTQHKAFTK